VQRTRLAWRYGSSQSAASRGGVRRRKHPAVLARPADRPAAPAAALRRYDLRPGDRRRGVHRLWAALLAKEEDPSRDVVILEGDAIAEGASGRNGGFVEASLTHGLENGLSRFPDEIEELERLGRDNMAGLEAFLDRHGIDAAYEKNGMLVVAREPHEEQELAAHVGDLRRFGYDAEYLGLDRVRQEVDSPTFRGALWQRTSSAIVDPAKLAWGLAGVAQSQGVRIHEGVAGH
jgi:glycine/D-amino acid oxidase-like deaminating enzyme